MIFPMRRQIANPIASHATIVEPTGVPNKMAIRRPTTAQMTEKIAAMTVTFLKLLDSLIADSAGKTSKAVIKKVGEEGVVLVKMAVMIAIMRL